MESSPVEPRQAVQPARPFVELMFRVGKVLVACLARPLAAKAAVAVGRLFGQLLLAGVAAAVAAATALLLLLAGGGYAAFAASVI